MPVAFCVQTKAVYSPAEASCMEPGMGVPAVYVHPVNITGAGFLGFVPRRVPG